MKFCKNVIFKITGRRGGGYWGDIAIDNFEIRQPCASDAVISGSSTATICQGQSVQFLASATDGLVQWTDAANGNPFPYVDSAGFSMLNDAPNSDITYSAQSVMPLDAFTMTFDSPFSHVVTLDSGVTYDITVQGTYAGQLIQYEERDPFYFYSLNGQDTSIYSIAWTIDGSNAFLSTPPSYNSNHAYNFTYTASGSTVFEFTDTDYSDN